MRFRKLRIAWSVAWGVVCLLMIALWVRSYWWADNAWVCFNGNEGFSCWSVIGELRFGRPHDSPHPLRFKSMPTKDRIDGEWYPPSILGFRWAVVMNRTRWWPTIPDWFPVLLFTILAAIPLIRWRFSVRALLIATTLAGVAFGLTIYGARELFSATEAIAPF
jgi:hypothetical protein